jgi:Trk K+ transport system NAD-binding subunit
MTALYLAQISEFSLIIVSVGFNLGQISESIFSLSVILAILTFIITSYFITYGNKMYYYLSHHIKHLESMGAPKHEMHYLPEENHFDAILIGYDRIGYSIRNSIDKINKKMIIIDFNPDIIRKLIKEKIPCIYGDIADPEILDRINLKDVEIVISTAVEKQDNLMLLERIKKVNRRASVFVTANRIEEALDLYDAGADYVILPHFLGGDHVSVLLEDVTSDITKLIKTKIDHIEELKRRKDYGHEHPKHVSKV